MFILASNLVCCDGKILAFNNKYIFIVFGVPNVINLKTKDTKSLQVVDFNR